MKLITFQKIEDYGTEYQITIFRGKTRSFFQFEIGWYDCPSSPYFQISMGMNNLLDVLVMFGSLGLSFCFFSFNWERP